MVCADQSRFQIGLNQMSLMSDDVMMNDQDCRRDVCVVVYRHVCYLVAQWKLQ